METIDAGVTGRRRRTLTRRQTRRGPRLARAPPKRPLLTSKQVRDRYSVCGRTIERWEQDPRLNFPRPLVIRRRKYFDPDDLDAFDATQSADA